MQVAFLCYFRQGVAGISRDLGRDVPDLEKLDAKRHWADFAFPKVEELKKTHTHINIKKIAGWSQNWLVVKNSYVLLGFTLHGG